MADSLPNSIGLSAVMRYDEFVAMIGPDKVQYTQELYNRLTGGNLAAFSEKNQIEPVRIDTAFVGLLEHFASEDVDRTVAVNTQTVLAVWVALLKVQLDSQKAAVTAKAAAASGAAAGTSMQMDDDDAAVVPPAKAAEGSVAAKPDANSFAAVNALT